MQQLKLVVVIPVGPEHNISYVRDTIESIFFYMTRSKKVLILNDSGGREINKLTDISSDIVILDTPLYRRRNAALYYTLSKGFEFAYRNYVFEVLLKMDIDALVIGHEPEADAVKFFKENPECGSIGSYKQDCAGRHRDILFHGNRILQETGEEQLLQHPERASGITFLRKILQASIENDYEPGENCQGGAHFISGKCIEKMYHKGLFLERDIFWSESEDDVLFGLFMYSTGLKHGDFATGSLPIGVRWSGLPCSPQDLVAHGKKITHSTRFYENLSEENIRNFFKQHRMTSINAK